MLLGQVPLLKDTKANVKDMIAIDPNTLGKFLNIVKQSLNSAIKIGAAPLEDMKMISFENENELLDTWTRTEMSISGMDTALLYSSQVKANLVDSQLSFQSDSKIVEQQLYPQFNAFLDYWVNLRLKKFKYIFQFEGNDYYLDRQQRFDKSIELAKLGIILPQKIAASIGLKPHEFLRMLDETNSLDFVNSYAKPLILSNQLGGGNISGGNEDKGRPAKSDSELGDAGAQTRGAGGNISRK